MKQLLIILAASLTIMACRKDNDSPNTTSTGDTDPTDYEFKDQTLQGKVFGQDWEFKYGYASLEAFHSVDTIDSLYTSGLYHVWDSVPCNHQWGTNGYVQIIFKSLKKGLYRSGWNSQDDHIYFQNEGNLLLADGYFEIVEIDTINKIVQGRMDAEYDENKVNGNFTIHICE